MERTSTFGSLSLLHCTKCSRKFESRDLLAMHMLDHSHSNADQMMTKAAFPLAEGGLNLNITAVTDRLDRFLNASDRYRAHNFFAESQCEICQEVRKKWFTIVLCTIYVPIFYAFCYKKSCIKLTFVFKISKTLLVRDRHLHFFFFLALGRNFIAT